MGGIWKPTGRTHYRIWYKDHLGQRRTCPGFKDKSCSEKKLADLERDEERRAAGLPVVDRTGKAHLLEDVIGRYVADLKRQGLGPDHLRSREGELRRLARKEGWLRLGDVQHTRLTEALARLDAEGRAGSTVNHYRKSWVSFFAWCVDSDLIPENHLGRVKPARHVQPRRPKRAFTLEEWRRLLHFSPAYRSRVYLVAGLTGLRHRELARLEVRDVDLGGQKLRLRQAAQKGKRAEVVPLLPDILPALQELCSGREPHDRLFGTVPGRASIIKDIRSAGIASPDGSGRFVSFHSLRYFFCTLVARTLPIQIVRLLMRHKDISVTCKVYLDLGLDDVAQEVLKLPSVLAHPTAHFDDATRDATP